MYVAVLGFHSIVRWIILALGSLAVFSTLTQGAAARRRVFPFVVALDLQLIAGAVLWLALSPLTRNLSRESLRVPEVRTFAVEHPVLGLLAVILAHGGNLLLKRGKTRTAALLLAAALAVVLVNIPWARPMFRT
jgi:hypothetical protein